MNPVEKKRAYQREYQRKYYRKNREKILEAQKIKNRERYGYKKRKVKIKHSKESQKSNRKKQNITNKNNYLKRTYGISLEDYNYLFNLQEGKCSICGTHQSELGGPLVVDHCHAKDSVRGLLCNKCNLALGLLGDDIQGINRAKEYLENNL